jgi:Immunity protein 63
MVDHKELAKHLSYLLSQLYGRHIVHDGYQVLKGDEGPKLIIDSSGYHLVWIERGREALLHRTTAAQSMIVRLIFDSTFSTGVEFERHNRVKRRDVRRLIHAKQRDMWQVLDPTWRALMEAELEAQLTLNPYQDEDVP